MLIFYKFPAGYLGIEHDGEQIIRMKFISEEIYLDRQNLELAHYFTNTIRAKLDAYFEGSGKELYLPLKLEGTEFEIAVLNACRAIAYGETATYKQLAEQAGHPAAARAVGNVMHNNPYPILIPCHRVVGSDEELHGYAGGLEIKQWLLEHESKHKSQS